MAILTFAGKLLGMIREVVQANYYGTGMVSDAYVMAQKIPDAVMAAVISAAALSYMPMLSSKLEKEGLIEGKRFTSQLINLLMLVSGGVAILGSVFAPRIVGLLAWGYEGETAELTVFYMRWVFISIIFNAVVVIMEAYLQYRNVFLPQPILGYVQNISIISFMVLSSFI
ncbi:MAG TPA: lipid II flippase MurJ, partial [Bacillota bacterium]|nr:lipid II flippase MurJ [Bacillota bacterium]